MDKHSINVEKLAAQVREGNPHAAAQLRCELQPFLSLIVGRALRTPDDPSPLNRELRAVAQRLAAPGIAGADAALTHEIFSARRNNRSLGGVASRC